jgi:hypothetical protein
MRRVVLLALGVLAVWPGGAGAASRACTEEDLEGTRLRQRP